MPDYKSMHRIDSVRIHVAFADFQEEYNTSAWRCFIPALGLVRAGHDVTISHYTGIDNYDAEAYLVERNLFDDRLVKSVNRLVGAGKRVVVTFDDAYHLMPDYSPTKKTWSDKALSKFYEMLGIVDCVIVPNKLLVEDYRQYCKDIRYVPNYADPAIYFNSKKLRSTVNILWGGNVTHLHSLKESGLLDALGKLCEKDDRVRIVTVSDLVCKNTFARYLPSGRLLANGWMPLAYWPRFVSSSADIIVCPLSGEYDRRRSWVKVIDAVMFDIPLVASNLEPFRGTGALLVDNTQRGWNSALADMSASGFRRKAVARKIKRSMGDVTIDAHIKEYEEVLGAASSL